MTNLGMITCPTCGEQTEGVNHNERGWRCTNCFTMLPAKEAASAQKGFEAKAAQTKELTSKPEYSPSRRAEYKALPEMEPAKLDPAQGNRPKRG